MTEQKIRKKLENARSNVWVKEYNKAFRKKIEKTCEPLLPVYLLHFCDDEFGAVSHIEEIKDIDRLSECSSDFWKMFDTYGAAHKKALELIDKEIKSLNMSIKKYEDALKSLEEVERNIKETEENDKEEESADDKDYNN